MQENKRNFLRRAFMGLGIGGLGIGAVAMAAKPAKAQGAGGPSRAVMEPQDAWLDALPDRHRLVFDTISQEGVGRALTFCRTFYAANKSDYGIGPEETGVVMIFRAGSTAFGYNDVFWAKYGPALADRYTDPATKAALSANIYNTAQRATTALTLDGLARMGAKFAVCSVASHGLAASLAAKTGETADAVFAQMKANLVTSAQLAAAGIVAVNRAQEHHYALCYTA